MLDPSDDGKRDSPLARLVDAGVNVSERRALPDQACVHGPVVDGAENPHIETARIAAEPPAGQVDFVSGDEGRGNLPESEGRRSQESLETTERRLVGLSRPKLSVRLQMPDSILREAGQVLRIFPHNTISKNRINYR